MAETKFTLPPRPGPGAGWKEWLKWAAIVAALLAGTYGSLKESVGEDKVKEVVKQELGK